MGAQSAAPDAAAPNQSRKRSRAESHRATDEEPGLQRSSPSPVADDDLTVPPPARKKHRSSSPPEERQRVQQPQTASERADEVATHANCNHVTRKRKRRGKR